MIPKQLTLRNFLSYRQVVLEFAGLHVACVCGANGAGKSSLLEAIAWCLWGQSRVSNEDDIIHQGAKEAQVSFCFEHGGQTYRVIRTRRRAQATALEFQVQVPSSAKVTASSRELTFRTITQKGVRATQRYILQQLKIDYETFVNSAYLRQGRADEFMLKRPAERKQVLADLLKLDRYDALAEQAKEKSRDYKAQISPIEALITQLNSQLEAGQTIQHDYKTVQAQLETIAAEQQRQQQALSELKQSQVQRTQWQQQLALAEQNYQHQQQIYQASGASLSDLKAQLKEVEAVLAESDAIATQHNQLISLRKAEEAQAQSFASYQQTQADRLRYQQELAQQRQIHQQQLARLKAQLIDIKDQEDAIAQTIGQKKEIESKTKALREARKRLHQLNKTEAQSAPLRQRLRQIQGEITQAQTRLATRIEEISSRQAQMTAQQTQSPQLLQAAEELSYRISYLEQRREYQEAVRQKGVERRNFMERLQANQLNYEVALAQFDQTLQLLTDPDSACCPLCEQELASGRWQELRDRTLAERDEVQNKIWAIREQLAVSESEIQVLRQEYRELEFELAKYAPILEERGQLKAKLDSVDSLQERLQEMGAERAQLECCLQENNYAEDLQNELARLQAQLMKTGYDERDHALVRSQVDRLRWSELKQAELKRAEKQLAQLQQKRPQIEAETAHVRTAIAALENSPAAQQLAKIEEQLAQNAYSLAKHNSLRAQLRQAPVWQRRYEQLQIAQQQRPALIEALDRQQQQCEDQATVCEQIATQVSKLQAQIQMQTDLHAQISCLDTALQQLQTERDRLLAQSGRLQQQLAQLDTLQIRQAEQTKKLEDIRHKCTVYKSLFQAFGRNGIQALMIENLLPQLEAKTNQILGRLSNHQLHVQFVTQRSGRKQGKLIDTLDILIADARGTRPYETYSGGEAFRVNFAIRLAIARLLALRSGTALQMLIIDEGFGTQDRAGCDRLVAAIEAIAPDFACILTITHMPYFREAFQTRIDVSKDESGSRIAISE